MLIKILGFNDLLGTVQNINSAEREIIPFIQASEPIP